MTKETKTLSIQYHEYASLEDLNASDLELMQQAIRATDSAYAPYSNFHVGAALLLDDGTIVSGSNQENVAYPSGLCAERTALFAAGAQYPHAHAVALAIVARNPQGELTQASPCGACRQVMSEYETKAHTPLRTLLYLDGGRVREIPSVEALLPFAFEL